MAVLQLLTTGAYYIHTEADEFTTSLPFALAILLALAIDESIKHISLRWLPTEEQLRPSCYGEVVFPILFDGSTDLLTSALIFVGLTFQYILAGAAIGEILHC